MPWLVLASLALQVCVALHTARPHLSDCCVSPLKTLSTSAADGVADADASASARCRSAFCLFAIRPPAAPLAAAG